MRRLRLFIPLAIFIALAALLFRGLALDPTAMPSALIDDPVPEFSLSDLRDPERLLNREALLGEVALLNVWGTWCPSCLVEHPFLIKLAEREKLPIIGLAYKDDRDKALQWLARLGDPYVVTIFDPDGTLGIDLGVFGAPETYVLDHRGVIRYKHVGVVNEQVWQERLEPLIGELRRQADAG